MVVADDRTRASGLPAAAWVVQAGCQDNLPSRRNRIAGELEDLPCLVVFKTQIRA